MKQTLYTIIILATGLFLPRAATGQDLESILEEETRDSTRRVFSQAVFKTTRIVNAQSMENAKPNELIFVVSHHFEEVTSGIYDLFGIDNSNIRLGFEYGINDRLALGIGRSSYQKYYDASAKYKILRQQTGMRNIPLSISWFSTAAMKTLRYDDKQKQEDWQARLSYTHQVLIGRKMGSKLSLQLSPTLVHSNMVANPDLPNDMYALGAGGRYKITNWITLNAEYFYAFNKPTEEKYYNSASLGVDIDTGGHIFQLYFSNSRGMIEKLFLAGSNGNWLAGDIRFGFNITRVFSFDDK